MRATDEPGNVVLVGETPRVLPVAAALSALLLLTGCTADHTDGTSLDPADVVSAEDAQVLAENMGIDDPPVVTPIRVIRLDEWAETQIECLREAGYDVTYTADGEGISFPPLDEALFPSLDEARYVCELRYPVDPMYYEPLSDDQLKKLYAYRAEDLIDCLESEGYTVTVTPPSEASFVESGGVWNPYEHVSIDSEDLGHVSQACPQVPPDLWESR